MKSPNEIDCVETAESPLRNELSGNGYHHLCTPPRTAVYTSAAHFPWMKDGSSVLVRAQRTEEDPNPRATYPVSRHIQGKCNGYRALGGRRAKFVLAMRRPSKPSASILFSFSNRRAAELSILRSPVSLTFFPPSISLILYIRTYIHTRIYICVFPQRIVSWRIEK